MSTTEVEGILQLLKCLTDVAVYGVEIPSKFWNFKVLYLAGFLDFPW